jgi:exodeoxyribonuclease VII large subunit
VQTVTELTQSIRGLLETEFPFVTVSGEISNLRQPYSGHIYFTLKDSSAQIRAVLFKSQLRYLAKPPENGQQVVCRGRISVYEPRGEYQVIVDFIEESGTGALQLAFEQLKNRLADEGLFEESRKKPLPYLPETVFVITSPDGAALFDFLRIAGNRFPTVPINILPVRVQGEEAADEIITAFSLLNRMIEENPKMSAADHVVVLCRGGGSIEDLWTFNEEKVARAIVRSHIPVVSAIGHEVDFTISDFVADHRSPTPTAAARDVLPDQTVLKKQIFELQKRLASNINQNLLRLRQHIRYHQQQLGDPDSLITHARLRLDNSQLALSRGLTHIIHSKTQSLQQAAARLTQQQPSLKIQRQKQTVRELAEKLSFFISRYIERKRNDTERAEALLRAVSPLAVLDRGYAIVQKPSAEVVKSSRQVKKGEQLSITLHEGSLRSTVTDVE